MQTARNAIFVRRILSFYAQFCKKMVKFMADKVNYVRLCLRRAD